MPRLLFLGSVCADVILRVPRLPQTGEDLLLMGQTVSLGGCAYNAYAASRLFQPGEQVLFAPVGGGIWGNWVREHLQRESVILPIPPVPADNGCCYCLVDSQGERTFLCDHGAEYRFDPAWMPLLGDAPFDGAYLCGLEAEEATGEVLLDYLDDHPPKRLYFAPGPRICHIPPTRMARIFAHHPLVHLNAAEALAFTRQPTVASAAATLATVTQGDVVITLGPEGAYILWQERARVLPAPVTLVQDTIGAGDAHIGAIMALEAQGYSLEEATLRANRVAAAVVGRAGAQLPPEAFHACMKED